MHIDDEGTLPAPGTNTMANMSVVNVVPLRAVGQDADDLGASLNIEALIPPEASGPSGEAGCCRQWSRRCPEPAPCPPRSA